MRTPYGEETLVNATAVDAFGAAVAPTPLKNVTPKPAAVVTPLMDCEVMNVLLLVAVTTVRLETSMPRSHLWVEVQAPPLPSVSANTIPFVEPVTVPPLAVVFEILF